MESSRELPRRLINLEDAFDVQSVVSKRRSATFTLRDPRHGDEAQLPVKYLGENDEGSASTTRTEFPSGLDFESDREASRPYRRARHHNIGLSLRNSTAQSNAWSVFSGLSLSDVSLMSVIAPPIYADEIANSHHYNFDNRKPVPPLPTEVISDSEPLSSPF